VGGRLALITFNSLEDRAVKQFMQAQTRVAPELARLPVIPPSAEPRFRIVGRKMRPGADEIKRNPRARSAMLRVAERVR
jgi:16S rRNA (cytosine1402-N4)-methyltransferase